MASKRFDDTYFSREERFSLGIDLKDGGYYASFPVTIGVVDYEEYYRLTPDQYEHFLVEHDSALAFVESCRRREHDELLIQEPGWNRGTPI
ncbi:hypothetical protein OG976_19895 [Mycobacterium sp. NBC_00419]|uniref:hypothetical protein n=1 Tax=Mycobacterium sp. NBC_00419 TaxID=2975989 RepID=UPI002E23DE8E